MGVMPCSRKSCDNIMCDTYIPDIGYICNDCKTQFAANQSGEMSYNEIKDKLAEFMSTPKRDFPDDMGGTVDAFFNHYTSD